MRCRRSKLHSLNKAKILAPAIFSSLSYFVFLAAAHPPALQLVKGLSFTILDLVPWGKKLPKLTIIGFLLTLLSVNNFLSDFS